MKLSGKGPYRWAAGLLLASLLADSAVSAKKTQDPTQSPTLAPSASPSLEPTISTFPTPLPTTSPSLFPTSTPTTSPTLAPTESPTTSNPTESPTESSTTAPTAKQIAAQEGLTEVPTTSSTMKENSNLLGGDMVALLPIITFDVLLSDEDASIEEMESYFVMFLDGVLVESSDTYRFDYSHLDSNGLISNFQQPQPMSTRYRIKMDGIAYYFDEAPTRESLAQSLNVYFSFWGVSNLEEYLKSVGFQDPVVESISIDDENISFVSNVLVIDESQDVEKSEGFFKRVFYNDEDDLSKPAVISFYAGIIAIAVATALLVFRHKIGRKRLDRDREFQLCEETYPTTKNDDDKDQQNGISSKASKTIPMGLSEISLQDTRIDIHKSVSSRGVKASKSKCMKSSNKQPTDLENGKGKSGSGKNAARLEYSEERGNAVVDRKYKEEKSSSSEKPPKNLSMNEVEGIAQDSNTVTSTNNESGTLTKTPPTTNDERKPEHPKTHFKKSETTQKPDAPLSIGTIGSF